jgi:RND family efflux transporter MFP subunit
MIDHKKIKDFWPLMAILLIYFIHKLVSFWILKYQTNRNSTQIVKVVIATTPASSEHISLPGSLTGWHEAPLYARAKGYLHEWFVDIGYHVKKGDVLATIERPELDAKYKAASSYYKVMKANNTLAVITKNRWNRLVLTDSVSKQANDNKTYDALAIKNATTQAKSNMNYLGAYVEFEKIIAPFDGLITDRQTDNGQLINKGSLPLQNKPLFKIVQTNPLRLYVNIPQIYTPRLRKNMNFELTLNEFPGRVFKAKLLKTAEAIDPVTLTLQSEFEVDNSDHTLLPGAYTTVEFFIPFDVQTILLPVNTLLFQADGLQVAVLNKTNQVELRSVVIAKDFGNDVLINTGVKVGEKVILNPPDTLVNGDSVRVQA